MITGIIKEKLPETRVALTPENVKALIQLKIKVLVESGAGINSCFLDNDYGTFGAEIVARNDIFTKSDMILSVSTFPPDVVNTGFDGRVIVGCFNPFFNREMVEKLKTGKTTSFSLELIPRTTLAQSMDVNSSMATISGYRAVLEAAQQLHKFFPMFMTAAGTIKPAKMLILGAGVAGLQALATARRLGAVVEVFDVRSAVKEEVMSLGGKFIEVSGANEDKSEGGYAIEQDEDFKKKQIEMIHQHAVKSDVVICAAQIPGKKAPLLLRKETVESMKPGSVIIDLASATGGNCEVTSDAEMVQYHGIKVLGRSDYPIYMPIDASLMYGNNLLNFLKLIIGSNGELNLDWKNEIVKGTCLSFQGNLMNDRIKNMYGS